MFFSRNRFRNSATVFLLILFTVGAAIQMPFVQTALLRIFVLPRVEKALETDINVAECYFDWWNQKITIHDLIALHDENPLFSIQESTIQWNQSDDSWDRIDSIAVEGLKFELTQGAKWLDFIRQKAPKSENESAKTTTAFNIRVATFLLRNAEGSIESDTIFQIDEARINQMHYRDESLSIPLKACSGFISVPLPGNMSKPLQLEVNSLNADLELKHSMWSLDTLCTSTSAFDAHFYPSEKSNEWQTQIQIIDSIDFRALTLDPQITDLLSSISKPPIAPVFDGRVWINEVTHSVECALAIEGIPALGDFTDSLRIYRNDGLWSSNGELSIDWDTIDSGLFAILGDRMPASLQKLKNQGNSIQLRWDVDPITQQFDFGVPMLGESTIDLKVLCSSPWTPTSFQGNILNFQIPLFPFENQVLSGTVLGQIEKDNSSLAITVRNVEDILFNFNAQSIPQLDTGNHRIDAQWKSESHFLPMSGDCSLALGDSSWSFNSATELNGIQSLNLTESKEWALFAAIAFRASGNYGHQWSSILETRNIALLENKKPIAVDRFDAMLEHQGQQIHLEWHSDLTNGRLTASDDLSAWNNWFDQITGQGVEGASVPFVEFNASLLNFYPLQLITNAPFSLAPYSSLSGKWHSDQLLINANIPKISATPFAAHTLQAQWTFKDSTSIFHLSVDSINREATLLASDFNGNVELGANWDGALTWTEGQKGQDAAIGFTSTPPFKPEGSLKITDFKWPVLGQNLKLVEANDLIRWSSLEDTEASSKSKPVTIQSRDWTIQAQANQDAKSNWLAEMKLEIDGKLDSIDWFPTGTNISSLIAQVNASTSGKQRQGFFQVQAEEIEWSGERISNLTLSGNGSLEACAFNARGNVGFGEISGNGEAGWGASPFLDASWELNTIELNGINQLIPENTFNLNGGITGRLKSQWKNDEFQLSGKLKTDSLTTFIPALGTTYTIAANVEIEPGSIQINQGRIQDRNGAIAQMNGTAYHQHFKNWNLDFGIDANSNPIELMNLPPKESSFYFGSGIGTGDINVAGYGSELLVEADISTKKGTNFALPLDAVSDASYAQFIQFKTTDSLPLAPRKTGSFSNVVLDIGLDVEPEATARIIFNQNTGEEISGKAKGHLDLRVDHFEEINLKGSLEIIYGTYYFTLQNLINKTFNIVPGGTIEWFGDPYAARINLLTSYQTRARLTPLLPDEPNLPGRVPVELLLSLNGGLFQPEIGFNIQVPKADSRLEALIKGALLNEEELQRQALSLLVVNQFIAQDPLTSALGGFQGGGQSSAFIANQLGHWISQISPGMDLGLDYSNDNLSGEQELALALSTQLFNERLKIEGGFGAQSTGQMSTDDIQIQDVTISYNLDSKGHYQITGQSKSNQSMINTLDGRSTQGVGIRMRHEFNRWGDWRIEKPDGDMN